MTADQTETSEHEQRLGAALADCLEAMDDGRAPDRADLLARHPEFAAELGRFLDDQERVERCAKPLRAAALGGGAGETLADQSRLGDFRIVREVGRGGMGVVYEAEQVSLRRRVALKVLPFAAAMDPRALQRFQNEALAAACLHHTNIVPVFAVGCERGVSFYAMQFIDGTTLADVIRELRPSAGQASAPAGAAPDERTTAHAPADEVAGPKADTEPAARQSTLATQSGARGREFFRRAAGWGVQAAEALDHAHQAAIVHRDVKPGNLLLDGRDQLWVADFGLAHVRQGEASLTMTGDLVGTLRYMSPEQALAKRVPIDHRTDVYSLGATLYELLTLRPALTGKDRQELLRQIAFEEPTPPRRLNKAIPQELEIIVLKAMEKNPADRYATAQEMADDLRRFLDDKPIRARRPSWRQVAAKWARRHRSAVTAAAVALLAIVAVLGAGAGWVLGDRATRRAETERAVATALQDSDSYQTERRWPDALSAAKRAEGLLVGGASAGLRQRVQERRKDVEVVLKLEQLRLERTGKNAQEIDQGYGNAFRDLEIDVDALEPKVAADLVRARSVGIELAAALDTWAFMRRDMERKSESAGWKRLLAVARSVDRDDWRSRLRDAVEQFDVKALKELAASDEISTQRSETLTFLADMLIMGKANQEALAMLHRANKYHPDDVWISDLIASLSCLIQPPQLDEALRFATASVALRPNNPVPHNNLAYILESKGRLDEAIAEYQEAVRLKKDVAETHNNLGEALHAKGRRDEALGEYQQAVRLKGDYAEAHYNLGNCLRKMGRLDEAIAEFRDAIRLQQDYAEAHCDLAGVLKDKGQFAEALVELRLGHELGSRRPDWPYPSAQWLREAERLADLDARLPALLKGPEQPKDANERLAFAQFCQLHKQFFAAAARFFEQAFVAEPKLAENLPAGNRYNAACAAALAGCGQGKDAGSLDVKERARLRSQALKWLQADWAAWKPQTKNLVPAVRTQAVNALAHWRDDDDLAGVRGADALAKLPEGERADWRQLWADLDALLPKAKP